MKTLYLKQGIDPSKENGKQYTVTKTIDTVYYSIDQVLSEEMVTALCNDAGMGAYKIIIS